MSLNRTRFWYEGAERVHFDYYHGLPIDYPSGASELAGTLSTAEAPDGVGVEVQRVSVPERNVTINGYIIQLPTAPVRRLLERAFCPAARGRLWAETEEAERFYLDCISSAAATIEGARSFPRFQVQLSAPYPYWQRDREETVTLAGAGSVTADIGTDVPALFTLAVTAAGGAASGIRLTVGGEYVYFSGTLAAGQTLTVSSDAAGRVSATVGGSSVIGQVSGALKKLPAGRQTLTLTAQGAAGTVSATIKYREARAGV